MWAPGMFWKILLSDDFATSRDPRTSNLDTGKRIDTIHWLYVNLVRSLLWVHFQNAKCHGVVN